jgi:hypothetical protein
MVGPISPPGMEKSVGNRIHFWIRWAFEVAFRLYLQRENKTLPGQFHTKFQDILQFITPCSTVIRILFLKVLTNIFLKNQNYLKGIVSRDY